MNKKERVFSRNFVHLPPSPMGSQVLFEWTLSKSEVFQWIKRTVLQNLMYKKAELEKIKRRNVLIHVILYIVGNILSFIYILYTLE